MVSSSYIKVTVFIFVGVVGVFFLYPRIVATTIEMTSFSPTKEATAKINIVTTTSSTTMSTTPPIACPRRERPIPILPAFSPVLNSPLTLPSPSPCTTSKSWPMGDTRLGPLDHVVLASTADERYMFFTPLTATVWTQLGFHPIVFLIGPDWSTSARGRLVSSFLSRLPNVTTIHLVCSSEEAAFMAQFARLFASSLPFLNPSSWMAINDVDMWPMWRNPYVVTRDKKGGGMSNNAACCGTFGWRGRQWQELPMGSVAMSVEQWRRTMQWPQSVQQGAECAVKAVRERCQHMFDGVMTSVRGAHWRDDQYMMSVMIWSDAELVKNMVFVGRGNDRLDRSDWPNPACLPQMAREATDAHLPIPGQDFWENNLQMLFNELVRDKELQDIANGYAKVFKQMKS